MVRMGLWWLGSTTGLVLTIRLNLERLLQLLIIELINLLRTVLDTVSNNDDELEVVLDGEQGS